VIASSWHSLMCCCPFFHQICVHLHLFCPLKVGILKVPVPVSQSISCSHPPFSLLWCKAQRNLPAGLESWLGFSSHWGHHLASSSHWKLEIPMQLSQLHWFRFIWIWFGRSPFVLFIKKHRHPCSRVLGFLLGCYHKYSTYVAIFHTYQEFPI
jgi:hypothetical protein